MDVNRNQIPTKEEQIVLRSLALSAARDGCKILEIGSWCGDSSVVLGTVAREKGGQLYCVDWWRGNTGTNLMEIAARVDVFSIFWQRVCSEKLDTAVVPIRGRSDVVSEILRNHAFDLVFIDGDHRYESVLSDLRRYAPLVRTGGILCGHDCEGRISDYDQAFLDAGKEVDYFETVHCGVVLAVGSTFKDYSINHGIWSVRAKAENDGWEATDLLFPEIEDRRQPLPPVIAHSKNYQIQRYGKSVYAIPRTLKGLDIRLDHSRNNPQITVADSVAKLAERLGEPLLFPGTPELLECYKGYNLVGYEQRVFALARSLGPLDLRTIDEDELTNYQEACKCFIGRSLRDAKRLVRRRARKWPLSLFP
jgi:hypothetical protein